VKGCPGPRRHPTRSRRDRRRRQFSAGEKRALLAEADRCKQAGTLGAFLRSKRIYSSMLSSWRKQLGAADRVALAPKRRGQSRTLRPGRSSSSIARTPVCAASSSSGADHRCPKKNYVRYWGCRPRTIGARRSDECRSALMPHIGLSKACRAFALNRGFGIAIGAGIDRACRGMHGACVPVRR